ncbi:MAG: heme NO-binding domain-containing protein, partial [Boseongicola sp.]
CGVGMHGLVNRALQRFVCDTYGADAWTGVTDKAAVGVRSFESMLRYDDTITDAMLSASVSVLDKPKDALLEDLGIYLVAHPNCEVLRRLLRFGGDTFSEFLSSLDDLPERARLAVPDLDFPVIETIEVEICTYEITLWSDRSGPGHVLAGVLRGMADDYGALATIDYQGFFEGGEKLAVRVHDMAFAKGRKFNLSPSLEP